MKAPITLIKGEKIGVETDYRDALPVNMFAVHREILGAQGYMLEHDGLTSFAIGEGIDRGAVYNDRFSNQYRLSGTSLLSVASDGTAVNLGTIPGTSQARLEDFYSFNTQGAIADGKFFLYDTTVGFREVTDADLGSPIDGIWIDGYYFMTDGEYIFHTDLLDESAIDPLKFATAEFMPDPSNGLSKTQDNKVAVWGRYSLEYFVNAAADNFAFSRVATRAQKIGIVATHAKCESQGLFYIVGGRKGESVSVHVVSLGSSEVIATREIDKILAKYTEPELSDIRVESRVDKNTNFILFHLPEETLCFNQTVAKVFGNKVAWNILKTGVTGESNYRAVNGVFDARNALWIYGDKRDTTIGKLDDTVATHYTTITEWELFSPFINLENFSIDEIEIEIIPGHTSFVNGKVALSFTYNGVTYGTEAWLAYGEPNDYSKRFIVRRLGYVNDWVGIKLRGVSKTKMAFALMEVTYS
jgi:hypothetical protein